MPTSLPRVPPRRAHLLLALAALLTGTAPAAAQIGFAPLANQPSDNIYSIVTEPGTGTLYACNGLRVITSTNQGATWASVANSGAEKAGVPPTVAGVFKYNIFYLCHCIPTVHQHRAVAHPARRQLREHLQVHGQSWFCHLGRAEIPGNQSTKMRASLV
jgi:hypothetical protein